MLINAIILVVIAGEALVVGEVKDGSFRRAGDASIFAFAIEGSILRAVSSQFVSCFDSIIILNIIFEVSNI